MGKIRHWKEVQRNVNLDVFCDPTKKCPKCGQMLECEEDNQKIIKVCPNCDYTDNHEK